MAQAVFRDLPVIGGVPESLRLYILCKNMRWAHLPVAGGLYDQHPKLLDEWMVITRVDNEEQARRERERERKSSKAKSPGWGGGRR